MSVIDAVNNILASASDKGLFNRVLAVRSLGTVSAATATSGYVTTMRMGAPIVMPAAFGTGITRAYLNYCKFGAVAATVGILGLEYTLLTFRYVNITMTANVNNTLTITGHGCNDGDFVQFRTATTLPAPLAPLTNYYVINSTTNTMEVSLTSGGAAIDITDTGVGAHTLTWVNTPGVTMPTKNIRVDGADNSVQTASLFPLLAISTNLTGATNPVYTITYTDQDGNSGANCTMTLPSSPAASSTYQMAPHLASGDTGIRAISDMTSSVNGTAGVFKLIGVLPLAIMPVNGVNVVGDSGHFMHNFPIFPVEVNESINMYILNNTAQNFYYTAFSLAADI